MAAEKGQQAVAVASGNLPQGYDLEDILNDAGAGQNMAAGDLGIPYITVLQSNSPQVNPGHAKYIEGAQAGMFMNTATGEVFDGRKEGIVLIPCAYQRDYDEWKDRDGPDGGGFVASHPITSDIMSRTRPNAKNKPALDNGNVIWETAKQFCLFRHPSGRPQQVLMTMKSTHLKTNRRWNNLINGSTIPGTDRQAPRWLFAYRLTTQLETKGPNSYFVPVVERLDDPVTVEEYRAGKAFYEAFSAGQVNVTPPPSDDDVDGPTPGSTGTKPGDDEIPY